MAICIKTPNGIGMPGYDDVQRTIDYVDRSPDFPSGTTVHDGYRFVHVKDKPYQNQAE